MFILRGVSRLTNISIAVLVQMMAQQSERGFPEGFQKAVSAFPALRPRFHRVHQKSKKRCQVRNLFFIGLRFANASAISFGANGGATDGQRPRRRMRHLLWLSGGGAPGGPLNPPPGGNPPDDLRPRVARIEADVDNFKSI